MKKLIFLALLAMAVSAGANDITIKYADTITAADSNDVRVDTIVSRWYHLSKGRFINFGVHIAPDPEGLRDTNWVDDTMFIKFQTTFDASSTAKNWIPVTTFEVDTLLDTGRAIDESILDADATVLPPWGRLMFIHFDSIGTGDADSALVASRVFEKLITLWYNIR